MNKSSLQQNTDNYTFTFRMDKDYTISLEYVLIKC